MALAFNKTKGSAKKGSFDQYQYKVGDNKVRIFGGILPRYVYWVDGTNGSKIPMECLRFDRDTESFTADEKDYVQEFFPDIKASWSYTILCIDPSDDDKIKVLNLKRKLLEQIMTTAEDLGDPTDLDTGWWVHFKKVKTGSHAFNVEYQLQPLKCKNEPLSDELKAAIAEHKTIDETIVRPKPEEQKKLLERFFSYNADDEQDSEIENEMDIEDGVD